MNSSSTGLPHVSSSGGTTGTPFVSISSSPFTTILGSAMTLLSTCFAPTPSRFSTSAASASLQGQLLMSFVRRLRLCQLKRAMISSLFTIPVTKFFAQPADVASMHGGGATDMHCSLIPNLSRRMAPATAATPAPRECPTMVMLYPLKKSETMAEVRSTRNSEAAAIPACTFMDAALPRGTSIGVPRMSVNTSSISSVPLTPMTSSLLADLYAR
mmetsp:Transcript_14202/g.34742  ORF Transcript_14202/g.34742 Transcript_14202/m.34742 type:complete len:214 (-) Transcript_14202:945-1586(-)